MARASVAYFALLVAGCASFQNTPAQDRVWVAYAVCRQLPGASGATIDRVEPNGRWWWTARTDSLVAANVINLLHAARTFEDARMDDHGEAKGLGVAVTELPE